MRGKVSIKAITLDAAAADLAEIGRAQVHGEFLGPSRGVTSATFDDRPDGWTIEMTFADPPGDWGIKRLTIDAGEHGDWVTIENLTALARELPELLAISSALRFAEKRSKAVASVGSEADRLSAVAETYLQAAQEGQRPVVAVMEKLGMSRGTANRRVREARDLGLLPPTGRESK